MWLCTCIQVIQYANAQGSNTYIYCMCARLCSFPGCRKHSSNARLRRMSVRVRQCLRLFRRKMRIVFKKMQEYKISLQNPTIYGQDGRFLQPWGWSVLKHRLARRTVRQMPAGVTNRQTFLQPVAAAQALPYN